MAKCELLLSPTTFTHFAQLHRALRAVSLRPYITKTQGDAIAHSVDERAQYPVALALMQRTPKGTVYVFFGREHVFQIDQRGAFSRPKIIFTLPG